MASIVNGSRTMLFLLLLQTLNTSMSLLRKSPWTNAYRRGAFFVPHSYQVMCPGEEAILTWTIQCSIHVTFRKAFLLKRSPPTTQQKKNEQLKWGIKQDVIYNFPITTVGRSFYPLRHADAPGLECTPTQSSGQRERVPQKGSTFQIDFFYDWSVGGKDMAKKKTIIELTA